MGLVAVQVLQLVWLEVVGDTQTILRVYPPQEKVGQKVLLGSRRLTNVATGDLFHHEPEVLLVGREHDHTGIDAPYPVAIAIKEGFSRPTAPVRRREVASPTGSWCPHVEEATNVLSNHRVDIHQNHLPKLRQLPSPELRKDLSKPALALGQGIFVNHRVLDMPNLPELAQKFITAPVFNAANDQQDARLT